MSCSRNTCISANDQLLDINRSNGGGISPNGWLTYGYASSQGDRPSMEDYHSIKIFERDQTTIGLFGVFDGHGGPETSRYLKDKLFDTLISHPEFLSHVKNAVRDTFQRLDDDFLTKEEYTNYVDVGSTAVTAIVIGQRLYVANVGDSRAVLCVNGTAVPLSRDHKPDRDDERERIERHGGVIMWAGTWRVGGILAVSRAFGDGLLKQFVIALPEIEELAIDNSAKFLVLASDGLWDVMSNQDVITMVLDINNPQEAAIRLTFEAYKRGSMDNVTCVIVRFQHDTNHAN